MSKAKISILMVALTMAIVSLIFVISDLKVGSQKKDIKQFDPVDEQKKHVSKDDKISAQKNDKANASGGYKGESVAEVKGFKAKGLYLSGMTAGDPKRLNNFINIVKKTELNALVIDIKEGGRIYYDSSVKLARENNLILKLFEPKDIVNTLHQNNIYAIARIVCFKDPGLALARPDLAIKTPDGSVWKEGKKQTAWLNPYIKENWKYNIDIALEAVKQGFDEIQFDYVRFPSARKSDVDYGQNQKPKTEVINEFLSMAKKEITDKYGVPVSADVFGIIAESDVDSLSIGQNIETIGKYIYCLCPMIYPSHYANASNGVMGNGVGQSINGVHFTAPDLKPYDVVYNSLLKIKNRIRDIEGYNAKIRPYLQDFTASYLPKGYYQIYGPEQVRQQIQAVYDAGFEEWLLWNASNVYNVKAFKPQN